MIFGIVILFPALMFQASRAKETPCSVDYAKLERFVQDAVNEKTMSRDHEMEAFKERVNNAERKVKEHDKEIQTLQNSVHVSERDVVNVGSPVGFMACVSPPNLLNLTDKHTILFDREITNTGGAYQNQTGVFTAPTNGLYAFYLTAMSLPGRHQYLSFVKDGVVISYLYPDAYGSATSVETAGNQWVVELNQGSEVWIQTYLPGEIHGNCYTVFSGFLLSEME